MGANNNSFFYLLFPEKINSSGGETDILSSFLILPTNARYLVSNGWTLRYTIYFYFIFSLGLLIPAKIRYKVIMSILLFLFGIGLLVSSENLIFNYLTSQLLLEFFLGMSLFFIYRKVKIKQAYALLLLSTGTIIFIKHYDAGSGFRFIDNGVTSFFFFMAILYFEPFFQSKKEGKFSKLVDKVGDSSYSLYLFHPFILVVVLLVLVKLELNKYGFIYIAVLITTALIGGHLCYVLIEKPLIKFTKRYLLNAKPQNTIGLTTKMKW